MSRPQGSSLIDPTLDLFFTSADKKGGPTDVTAGFKHVYTEIYIQKSNRAAKPQKSDNEQDEDESEQKTE